MRAFVFNVQRYCLHDGPGVRTAIFMKGCPLSCLWCHNPESQRRTPEIMYHESKCTGCGRCLGLCAARRRHPDHPERLCVTPDACTLCGQCVKACLQNACELCGRETDTAELFAQVMKDAPFYGREGGMTLSGGEPSMQPEASIDLLSRARAQEMSAVIETCGFGPSAFFEEAAALEALFYYDLKALNDGLHRRLTGVSNRLILSNLEMLLSRQARVVLRLPLIPGFNDSEEDLSLLARFLAEHEAFYDHAEIMKYHNLGLSKARALARDYQAPSRSANAEDARRWLDALTAGGVRKLVIS